MNAVEWLEDKSTENDLGLWEDNGITYKCSEAFFHGHLPYRMVQEVKKIAKGHNAKNRDCNKTAILNWKIGERRYALTTGTMKSTQCDVRFSWSQELPVS